MKHLYMLVIKVDHFIGEVLNDMGKLVFGTGITDFNAFIALCLTYI